MTDGRSVYRANLVKAVYGAAGSLTLEHGGRALVRYDIQHATGSDRNASVVRRRLFQTPYES